MRIVWSDVFMEILSSYISTFYTPPIPTVHMVCGILWEATNTHIKFN